MTCGRTWKTVLHAKITCTFVGPSKCWLARRRLLSMKSERTHDRATDYATRCYWKFRKRSLHGVDTFSWNVDWPPRGATAGGFVQPNSQNPRGDWPLPSPRESRCHGPIASSRAQHSPHDQQEHGAKAYEHGQNGQYVREFGDGHEHRSHGDQHGSGGTNKSDVASAAEWYRSRRVTKAQKNRVQRPTARVGDDPYTGPSKGKNNSTTPVRGGIDGPKEEAWERIIITGRRRCAFRLSERIERQPADCWDSADGQNRRRRRAHADKHTDAHTHERKRARRRRDVNVTDGLGREQWRENGAMHDTATTTTVSTTTTTTTAYHNIVNKPLTHIRQRTTREHWTKNGKRRMVKVTHCCCRRRHLRGCTHDNAGRVCDGRRLGRVCASA